MAKPSDCASVSTSWTFNKNGEAFGVDSSGVEVGMFSILSFFQVLIGMTMVLYSPLSEIPDADQQRMAASSIRKVGKQCKQSRSALLWSRPCQELGSYGRTSQWARRRKNRSRSHTPP